MFELSYLADRRRARCSVILTGCLLLSVGLTGCLFSHSYLTASVTRVFLNVQQNVGLFSVQQYAVFGGEEGRSRAKSATISLGDWERQMCPSGAAAAEDGGWENLETDNRICRYVTTLRGAGVVTCVLKVVTCLFLIFALHDLWTVARIDDTIMTTAPLTMADGSRTTPRSQVDEGGGTAAAMVAAPGTQGTAGGILDSSQHPYYALEATPRGLSVTRMPTVLALRTLQTVDNDTFAQLFQACADRLQRCMLSLRVALLLQAACSAVWILSLVRALQAKEQLSDFLTTWGEEQAQGVPVQVALGTGGLAPMVTAGVLVIFLHLHSRLLETDFKLVQQAGNIRS